PNDTRHPPLQVVNTSALPSPSKSANRRSEMSTSDVLRSCHRETPSQETRHFPSHEVTTSVLPLPLKSAPRRRDCRMHEALIFCQAPSPASDTSQAPPSEWARVGIATTTRNPVSKTLILARDRLRMLVSLLRRPGPCGPDGRQHERALAGERTPSPLQVGSFSRSFQRTMRRRRALATASDLEWTCSFT